MEALAALLATLREGGGTALVIVRASPATAVGDDLDDSDPQTDACDERGDDEPFMKGELRVGNPAQLRRVNAAVVVPSISIHRPVLP
jgi:hypothetical protein